MKKDNESIVPTSQELLDLSLELSKMHLARLREKSRSQEGLSPLEGNAICSYLKTFSAINKLEKEMEKESLGDVSKLSDEELKRELDKLVAGSGGKNDSDED